MTLSKKSMMRKFLLYRVSGEITKGNEVFMTNFSGEITKEIFLVFLFPVTGILVCQVRAKTPLCVKKV